MAEAPVALEPPPGNPRFPLFDSLRAIAALSILLTHAGYLSGANAFGIYGRYTARLDIGVTIFFLISGFLLYRPFVVARFRGRPFPRLGDYARKRALRIVPAYWLALTVLSIYPGLPQMFTGHSWAYYGFVQVYYLPWSLGGLLPAWSLCVEVSFYIALPFIALLLRRRFMGTTRRAMIRSEIAFLSAMFAAGVAFRVLVKVGEENGIPDSNLFSTLPGSLAWFALGMGLAVASVVLEDRERQPAAVRLVTRLPSLAWVMAAVLFWVVSTQIGITAAFPQVYSGWQWLGEHLLYGGVAFFLLLPAVFGDRAGGLPRIVLRNRVLAWLGLISYGIFLWHLPIVAQLATGDLRELWGKELMLGIAGVGFLLAVACASASYYLVERPLLRLKPGHRRPRGPGRGRVALRTRAGAAGRAG